jgi:hypothetical protein
MQLGIRYLALLSALQLGAFAQPVVLAPQTVPTQVRVAAAQVRDSKTHGAALVVDVSGSCKISTDGKRFHNLKPNAELPEHATIRTGSSATADLFIRRMGATVRLQPESEIVLDRSKRPGEVTTSIEVRKGDLLTVVYTLIEGSKLVVKNSAGQVLHGDVAGHRFNVAADSIRLAGSEKLASEINGDANEKMAAMIKQQIELDEVQGLAETSDNSNPGLEQ